MYIFPTSFSVNSRKEAEYNVFLKKKKIVLFSWRQGNGFSVISFKRIFFFFFGKIAKVCKRLIVENTLKREKLTAEGWCIDSWSYLAHLGMYQSACPRLSRCLCFLFSYMFSLAPHHHVFLFFNIFCKFVALLTLLFSLHSSFLIFPSEKEKKYMYIALFPFIYFNELLSLIPLILIF